jgi:biotin synthase
MVGIPGQTVESLAADIELIRELDLDMIGIGPYIAHPQTPLGRSAAASRPGVLDQARNDELMVYKMLALARLVCPSANIPSTTALATINRQSGHEQGLRRGANVVMPNLTPPSYRMRYEVYPEKASGDATSEEGREVLNGRIQALGRRVGTGPGGRRRL